jgi:hypothetical protein
MLYRISDNYTSLNPVEFQDFSDQGMKEKDLENLIAENLFDTIFEDGKLMPIFQERSWQEEADIYALNKDGDLFIFELKRGNAGEAALHQGLRYQQHAGKWHYGDLEDRLKKYIQQNPNYYLEHYQSLKTLHKENFDLDYELSENSFNVRQHLYVIGSASDNELANAIDYWRNSGLNIDFFPYRIYQINGEYYFEFFSHPYDKHINTANVKGVLFDTCESHMPGAYSDMLRGRKVAAYGDMKKFVETLNKKDYVFLYLKGKGLIGGGMVESEAKKGDNESWFRKVDFKTPIPENHSDMKAMPAGRIRKVLGKNFFWAKTVKVPYLDKDESEKLLNALDSFMKENI